MDPGRLPSLSLLTAFKWPYRIADLRNLFNPLPALSDLDRLLWDALIRCYEYGIPDRVEEFHERVVSYVQCFDSEHEDLVVRYIRNVQSRSDIPESYCLDLLKEHALRDTVMSVNGISDPIVVENAVARMEMIRSVGSSELIEEVNLFANDGADVLVPMPRIPVDCCVMQELFLGLPPPGTLTLIVMPRKAGKTMLSMQTSKASVNINLSVLYMNFEQDAKGDLAARVFSIMSGYPIDAFKNVRTLSECPPPVRRAFEPVRDMWANQFKILDANVLHTPGLFSKGVDGVHQIIDHMYIRRGRRPPDLIIVDWWQRLWNICSSSMVGTGRKDSSDLRQVEAVEFLKLKMLAGQYGCRVLVFQQMRHALAGQAKNISKLSVNDAAENKGLAAYADAGVVSTTKLEDNTVVFKLDADRNQNEGAIFRARMIGDRQLFIPYDTTQEQGEAARAANALEQAPSVT